MVLNYTRRNSGPGAAGILPLVIFSGGVEYCYSLVPRSRGWSFPHYSRGDDTFLRQLRLHHIKWLEIDNLWTSVSNAGKRPASLASLMALYCGAGQFGRDDDVLPGAVWQTSVLGPRDVAKDSVNFGRSSIIPWLPLLLCCSFQERTGGKRNGRMWAPLTSAEVLPFVS